MGAITQAMARAASARGVEIRTRAAVREVIVERGRAVGVVTGRQARRSRARAVVANVQSEAALRAMLVARGCLAPDFARASRTWRCGSGTFRMNVALSELPDFTCLPGRRRAAEHHTSGIIVGADARLHGARLFRCTPLRLVAASRSSRC